MIMLSRNTPVAFVVGAAGFIGSHLTDELLAHGIQVVGIDDFSSGYNRNLNESTKDKNFHLIRGSITENLDLKFPRLDYAFFVINSDIPELSYLKTFSAFLDICNGYKPKIVFVSSVDLYDNHNVKELSNLKQAEEKLARYSLENKANARVVRTSSVFGPRMHFKFSDPVCRLIKSAVLDELQKEAVPLDFSTRSLYIEDTVELLVKAVMHGGTAQKIYDGVRLHPIKVTEIKQVLLDPLWHEKRNFAPTELPPWPTPNIIKTMKELSWRPKKGVVTALKETVAYFRENPELLSNLAIEQVSNQVNEQSSDQTIGQLSSNGSSAQSLNSSMAKSASEDWGAKWRKIREESTALQKDFSKSRKKDFSKISLIFKKHTLYLVTVILLILAFFYPLASVAIDAVSIQEHLLKGNKAVYEADFKTAEKSARLAKSRSASIKQIVNSLEFLRVIKVLDPYLNKAEESSYLAEEITDAVEHLVKGAEALSEGMKAVSGESEGNSSELFKTAGFEFDQADKQLALSLSRLPDGGDGGLKTKLREYLSGFRKDISKSQAAANFLSYAIPKEGRKSYLILLQDNTTLRPGGGVAVAYSEVNFENGVLSGIKTGSIEEFESKIKEPAEPPAEVKSDLGLSDWSLRDYAVASDFPANARLAQWFYRRSTEVNPAGVVALDLKTASALKALSTKDEGADLVGQANSSKNKAEYFNNILKEIVNQVFFLSGQNLANAGQELYSSAQEKHLVMYMSDPLFFSYLQSAGWAGIVPEEGKEKIGEKEGFLAYFESSIGATDLNKGIKRSFKLESSIDKAGKVLHKLTTRYSAKAEGNSLKGTYKSRVKVYLPAGTKLIKSGWGRADITKEVRSFSDYGRAGYTAVLELKPDEEKEFVIEYQDGKILGWEADKAKYRIQVIKQPGTLAEKLDIKLDFPSSWGTGDTGAGEQVFSTDLSQDRLFEVTLKK